MVVFVIEVYLIIGYADQLVVGDSYLMGVTTQVDIPVILTPSSGDIDPPHRLRV